MPTYRYSPSSVRQSSCRRRHRGVRKRRTGCTESSECAFCAAGVAVSASALYSIERLRKRAHWITVATVHRVDENGKGLEEPHGRDRYFDSWHLTPAKRIASRPARRAGWIACTQRGRSAHRLCFNPSMRSTRGDRGCSDARRPLTRSRHRLLVQRPSRGR